MIYNLIINSENEFLIKLGSQTFNILIKIGDLPFYEAIDEIFPHCFEKLQRGGGRLASFYILNNLLTCNLNILNYLKNINLNEIINRILEEKNPNLVLQSMLFIKNLINEINRMPKQDYNILAKNIYKIVFQKILQSKQMKQINSSLRVLKTLLKKNS